MNIAQWNALCLASDEAGYYQLTMAAEDNASHTIHVEKEAPEAEFAELCLASLEGLLCDCDDVAAKSFFKSHGVRW